MKVYTNDQPAIDKDGRQAKLIHLWAESWVKNGWVPVVLHADQAMAHPFYHEITWSEYLRRTVNNWEYMKAVYCKWMNMALLPEGGVYSDPDVINYSLSPNACPDLTENGVIMCTQMMPSLLCGTKLFYELVSRTLRNVSVLRTCGQNCVMDDLSDMNIFRDYWSRRVKQICWAKNYREPGWELAPCVHYHMSVTGQVDRADLIQKVRPIDA